MTIFTVDSTPLRSDTDRFNAPHPYDQLTGVTTAVTHGGILTAEFVSFRKTHGGLITQAMKGIENYMQPHPSLVKHSIRAAEGIARSQMPNAHKFQSPPGLSPQQQSEWIKNYINKPRPETAASREADEQATRFTHAMRGKAAFLRQGIINQSNQEAKKIWGKEGPSLLKKGAVSLAEKMGARVTAAGFLTLVPIVGPLLDAALAVWTVTDLLGNPAIQNTAKDAINYLTGDNTPEYDSPPAPDCTWFPKPGDGNRDPKIDEEDKKLQKYNLDMFGFDVAKHELWNPNQTNMTTIPDVRLELQELADALSDMAQVNAQRANLYNNLPEGDTLGDKVRQGWAPHNNGWNHFNEHLAPLLLNSWTQAIQHANEAYQKMLKANASGRRAIVNSGHNGAFVHHIAQGAFREAEGMLEHDAAIEGIRKKLADAFNDWKFPTQDGEERHPGRKDNPGYKETPSQTNPASPVSPFSSPTSEGPGARDLFPPRLDEPKPHEQAPKIPSMPQIPTPPVPQAPHIPQIPGVPQKAGTPVKPAAKANQLSSDERKLLDALLHPNKDKNKDKDKKEDEKPGIHGTDKNSHGKNDHKKDDDKDKGKDKSKGKDGKNGDHAAHGTQDLGVTVDIKGHKVHFNDARLATVAEKFGKADIMHPADVRVALHEMKIELPPAGSPIGSLITPQTAQPGDVVVGGDGQVSVVLGNNTVITPHGQIQDIAKVLAYNPAGGPNQGIYHLNLPDNGHGVTGTTSHLATAETSSTSAPAAPGQPSSGVVQQDQPSGVAGQTATASPHNI